MTYESKPQPETARAAIESLGLSMTAKFVPYSATTDAKPSPKWGDMSLNWNVTIYRTIGDAPRQEVISSSYSAGVGHAPSYKPYGMTPDDANAVRTECEYGKTPNHGEHFKRFKPVPPPKAEDVLSCLVSEADAIDHPTFESWASDLGYDPDSRKAEATYRACLETALKLRAALGEDGLAKLREAFQDY